MTTHQEQQNGNFGDFVFFFQSPNISYNLFNIFMNNGMNNGNIDDQVPFFPQGETKEVTNPTDEMTIIDLPVFKEGKYSKVLKEKGFIPNENTCAICMEDFNEGEDLCCLNCNHLYHEKCIKEWLVKQNTCPNCRHSHKCKDKDRERQRIEELKRAKTKEEILMYEENGKLLKCVLRFLEAQEKPWLEIKKPELRKIEAFLMGEMLKLDQIDNFKTIKLRNDRRNAIKRIQYILSIIDKKLSSN